jgi:hypothetical protein
MFSDFIDLPLSKKTRKEVVLASFYEKMKFREAITFSKSHSDRIL